MTPLISFAQKCDTLYSNENYIERKITYYHRNCTWLFADTSYTIIQWNNFDPEYQTAHFLTSDCFSLVDSNTGKLIKEGWKSGDTSFTRSYYTSGKLKKLTQSFRTENPLYYWGTDEIYYESGGLFEKGRYEYAEFNERVRYYENGTLQSTGTYYDLYPGAWGDYKEYHPNGQLSSVYNYSMPDTTIRTFQQNKLRSTSYFSYDGKEINSDENELLTTEILIYPPRKSEWSEIANGLYAWEYFSDQTPYSNELAELKKRILNEIAIPEFCYCKIGVFWFSATVNKKGEIEIRDVEIEDPVLKKSVEDAIRKVKHWPPGEINGEKVDTFIYTFLTIE